MQERQSHNTAGSPAARDTERGWGAPAGKGAWREMKRGSSGMDDEERAFLKQVFGDSSESDRERDDDEEEGEEERIQSQKLPMRNFSWEEIKKIKGLWVCTDFLTPQQQSLLLSSVLNEGWFTETSHNQAMRFGDLPTWATELSYSIFEVLVMSAKCIIDPINSKSCNKDKLESVFPSNLLWREPLFDQLIVNVYQPGEGICAHVDLMRFEDGIAILSLESPCVMHFTRADPAIAKNSESRSGRDVPTPGESKVSVYLNPGSLVLMWGDARYRWKHEINRKPGFQIWDGQEVMQGKRTSITLRKLCDS